MLEGDEARSHSAPILVQFGYDQQRTQQEASRISIYSSCLSFSKGPKYMVRLS